MPTYSYSREEVFGFFLEIYISVFAFFKKLLLLLSIFCIRSRFVYIDITTFVTEMFLQIF